MQHERILGFLCIFVVLLEVATLNLPPWWDGGTTVMTTIDIIKNNMDFYRDFWGKPPLLFMSLGGLFKLFGYSVKLEHLLMLVFSLMAIIFTYKAGAILVGSKTAIVAATFLTFSPLFLAQTMNINFDLPSAALIMAAYYFHLREDRVNYAIFGSFLVMTKEVGILFAASVLASTSLNLLVAGIKNKANHRYNPKVAALKTGARRRAVRSRIRFFVNSTMTRGRGFISATIPVAVFGLWAYGNFTRRGWFVFPRNSPILLGDDLFNEPFLTRAEQLFLVNFNWILTLAILVFVLTWLRRRNYSFGQKIYRQVLPQAIFAILCFIFVVPVIDFTLPRYMIVLYPIFYIFAAHSIKRLTGKYFGLAASAVVILFVAQSLVPSSPFVFLDPVMQKFYAPRAELKYSTTIGGPTLEITPKYVSYVKQDIALTAFLNSFDTDVQVILNPQFNHNNIFLAAHLGIDLGYGLKSKRAYVEHLNMIYENPDVLKPPAIVILEDFNSYDLEKLSEMYDLTFIKHVSFRDVGVNVYRINYK